MSLYKELQLFYSEVHNCIKGRGKSDLAWEVINSAIESTQDGGTFFTIEQDEDSKCIVDYALLKEVLGAHGMDRVELEQLGGGK